MDAFLLHSVLLVWFSVTTARRLSLLLSDRILAAAVLVWANIVLTCLLLSLLRNLGEPLWFFTTSVALAAGGLALSSRVCGTPFAETGPRGAAIRPNPWVSTAFVLIIAPLAWVSVRSGWGLSASYHAALAYDLPRVLFYIGQNTLGHLPVGEPRQIWYPFNFNLLQLFVLVYKAPLSALGSINLVASGLIGLGLYRMFRLAPFNANAALVCTGLALTAWLVLGPALSLSRDLPAVAAVVCAVVFLFRWRVWRLRRDAWLAGLAMGLAAGSELAWLALALATSVVAIIAGSRRARNRASVDVRDNVRLWACPMLVALIFALPFAAINRLEGGRWLNSWGDLPRDFIPAVSEPATVATPPILIPFRLNGQPRINVDTDGIDEELLPLLPLGQGQHYTALGRTDSEACNLLSRSAGSRNAAYLNSEQLPSYVILPIANKPTAGVEFLGRVGISPVVRDYFGIGRHAGLTQPFESNRNLLVTLYHEPRGGKYDAARLSVAGLNPEDHTDLVVQWEAGNKSRLLTTFGADGTAAISIERPFTRILLRAVDRVSRVQLGAMIIPCSPLAPAAEPLDAELPSGPNSLFVTDLVLAKPSDRVRIDGLLPVEGPFPQWNLPFLRWTRSPVTRITLAQREGLKRIRLTFSVRLHVRKKGALDVVFNGRLIQHYPIYQSDVWRDDTLDFTTQAGPNVVEFRDGPINEQPDWAGYLVQNPDVKDYLVSQNLPLLTGAREHYKLHGEAERRPLKVKVEPEPAPDGYYFMFRNIRLEGFSSP